MKPGYKTTEFWLTTTTAVVSFCVTVGFVSTADGQELTDALTKIAGAVTVLGTNAIVVVTYIRGRVQQKVDAQGHEPDQETKPQV